MQSEVIKPADHFHGSDLEKIEAVFGIKKENIISFSANVNPLGLSGYLKEQLARHLDVITSYPDREYVKLRNAMAEYCHTKPEYILTGNGSTELISLMIQCRRPKTALVLGPSYSEYEREIALTGGNIRYFSLSPSTDFSFPVKAFTKALTPDIDMLILCNPNNPTSSVITTRQMKEILDVCLKNDILVMVDETYVEFTENYNAVTSIPLADKYDNIVILRGVSKFFAAPGLRLGYAVTSCSSLIEKARSLQNPWSVSSLAEAAGCILFSDTDYIQRSRALICNQRDHCVNFLSKLPAIHVFPAHANFLLAEILDKDRSAEELFEVCIRQGLMIRNCSTFHGLNTQFFRFCFMMPEDNDRLLGCIRDYLTT